MALTNRICIKSSTMGGGRGIRFHFKIFVFLDAIGHWWSKPFTDSKILFLSVDIMISKLWLTLTHSQKGPFRGSYDSLDVFWKSDMSSKLKVKIFRTALESILLYGCETWTPKVAQNNTLDGAYTKLLRRALNISCKSHTPIPRYP